MITDEVLRRNMLFPTNTYQGPTTPCHVFLMVFVLCDL